jgi:hypothetical protein
MIVHSAVGQNTSLVVSTPDKSTMRCRSNCDLRPASAPGHGLAINSVHCMQRCKAGTNAMHMLDQRVASPEQFLLSHLLILHRNLIEMRLVGETLVRKWTRRPGDEAQRQHCCMDCPRSISHRLMGLKADIRPPQLVSILIIHKSPRPVKRAARTQRVLQEK